MHYLIILTIFVSSQVYSKATSLHPDQPCTNHGKKKARGNPGDDPQIAALGAMRKMASMDDYSILGERLCNKYNTGNDIITEMRFSIVKTCLLYTSPSPRDGLLSRMPSSA